MGSWDLNVLDKINPDRMHFFTAGFILSPKSIL